MVSIRSSLGRSGITAFGVVLMVIQAAFGSRMESNEVESLQRELAESLSGLSSWKCSMEQTLTLPDAPPIFSRADLVFSRPDRLKMTFREPTGPWLLFQSGTAWFQQVAGRRQQVTLPAQGGPVALYQFLLDLLNGRLDLLQKGYVAHGEVLEGGAAQLVLLSSEERGEPKRVECTLDSDRRTMTRLRLVFSDESVILDLRFKNAVNNPVLVPSDFSLPASTSAIGTKNR